MKYKGRMVGLIITLLIFVFIMVHQRYIENYREHTEVVDVIYMGFIFVCTFASGLVGWYMGKKYDEVKFFSQKDPLTDAYNRRFVNEVFDKLSAQAIRNGKTISLLLIDIDDFKLINDRHGHNIGDNVLKSISDTLMEHTRKGDVVCRWGGDEFIIIAPYTDKKTSRTMIKRIDHQLSTLSINKEFDVSVSIGVALYPNDSETLYDLIEAADRDMYCAKEHGQKEDSFIYEC